MQNWELYCLSDDHDSKCIQWGMEWLKYFPRPLYEELRQIPYETLRDIRLYAEAPCRVNTLSGEKMLQIVLDRKLLYQTVQELCRNRLRISPEATGQGYITLEGGHRVGLCGRVTQEGKALVLQEVGSVCIRIAHAVTGCGIQTAEEFMRTGQGIVICGLPGSGKTTHLRDVLRILSQKGITAGLCDERSEVAACVQGVPQLDVGERTHVLDGCPKAEALRWLLRGMCPRVLAMDELYGENECEAICDAAACGVPVIATVHAADEKTLMQRKGVARLFAQGVFGAAVFLRGGQVSTVKRAEEIR
ncbi:MAG: Flp pilus assembly complex ATPase component TadA [Clostridia bacterium]|nr:Flp pilus assembly complex ATPase component TadA [Clostridia bacterium]